MTSTSRRTWFVVGSLATALLFAFRISASGPLQTAVAAANVGSIIGRRAIVCGDVVSVQASAAKADNPIRFDIGTAGGSAELTATIESRDRSEFPPLFDHYLAGRQVCVDGKIERSTVGPPSVTLRVPGDFKFFGAPPGRPSGFANGAVDLRLNDAVTKPNALSQVGPKYTDRAMNERIAGDVEVEGIVTPDGRFGHIRVVRSLDPFLGLDDQAISAALQWTFAPAKDGDRPVASIVTLVLSFHLTGDTHPGPPVMLQDWGARIVPAAQRVAVPAEPGTDAVAADAQGLVAPTIDLGAPPRYPFDALRQNVQGDVVLDVIVTPEGRADRVRVARSLANDVGGVDEAAMTAVKEWLFVPGKLDGRPVPTRTQVDVSFRLRR